MRFCTALVALTLGGCLSLLPPPDSTGVTRGLLGKTCVDDDCDGGFGCDDYGYCNDMCFDNADCKDGYKCCDSSDAFDTWDNSGTCPEAYECYQP